MKTVAGKLSSFFSFLFFVLKSKLHGHIFVILKCCTFSYLAFLFSRLLRVVIQMWFGILFLVDFVNQVQKLHHCQPHFIVMLNFNTLLLPCRLTIVVLKNFIPHSYAVCIYVNIYIYSNFLNKVYFF